MSIATDEAEQWAQAKYVGSSHIERHDGRAVSVPDYPQKVSLRAEGYVAGRTAEPTEAEIEAAAKRIFTFLNGPWQGEHYELNYVDGLAIADAAWETADKRLYEACAEFALQDVRQVVTA